MRLTLHWTAGDERTMVPVRVYSSQHLLMADHIRSLLESEGIRSVVENRHLTGLAGEVPFAET